MSLNNWPWDILELEEGARSRSDVRKAYARKLKLIDQEQEPEKFQQLRQAYEAARNPDHFVHFARMMPVEAFETLKAGADLEAAADEPKAPTETAALKPKEVPVISDADRALLEQAKPDFNDLQALCVQMETMLEARNFEQDDWLPLLTSAALDAPSAKSTFEFRFISALFEAGWREDGFNFYPPNAWMILVEDRFGWMEDGLRFFRLYPDFTDLHNRYVSRLTSSAKTLPNSAFKPVQAPVAGKPPRLPFLLRPLGIYAWYVGLLIIYYLVRG